VRLNIELEVLSSGDEGADAARMASLVAVFGVEVGAGVPGSSVDLAAQATP